MPTDVADIVFTIGRILLGAIFVRAGIHHFFIIDPLTGMAAERGVPRPRLVVIAGSLSEGVLGGLLILGLLVPFAAIGLILFTIAATVMFLDFWDKTGPDRDAALIGASTNVGIVGGLLMAAAAAW